MAAAGTIAASFLESNAMTSGSQHKTQLVLTNQRDPGRILVDVEAFFEFSFELAEDLQDLVHRWRHWAAPKDRKPVVPKKAFRR